jgi:hypothetical protein
MLVKLLKKHPRVVTISFLIVAYTTIKFIEGHDPYDPAVWGNVSEWFMVFVTTVSLYFLYQTLNSQKEVLIEQQRITKIEIARAEREFQPQLSHEILKLEKSRLSNHMNYKYSIRFINSTDNAIKNIILKSSVSFGKAILSSKSASAKYGMKHLSSSATFLLILDIKVPITTDDFGEESSPFLADVYISFQSIFENRPYYQSLSFFKTTISNSLQTEPTVKLNGARKGIIDKSSLNDLSK